MKAAARAATERGQSRFNWVSYAEYTKARNDMEHLRKPKLRMRGAFAFVAIVTAAGSFVVLTNDVAHEQPQTWMQCFGDVDLAPSIGSSAGEALMSVRVQRDQEQRKLRAHQRALEQLNHDARWDEPEQRQWLELATAQTRAQIEDLQTSEAEAGDTEGCLEQF